MSHKFPRLIIHDLLAEKPRFTLHERHTEIERIYGIVQRHKHNNVLLTGPAGVGKTAVLQHFMHTLPPLAVPYIQLDTPQLLSILHYATSKEACIEYINEAFSSLPECVVIIDQAEKIWAEFSSTWESERFLKPFIDDSSRRIVMAMDSEYITQYADLLKITSSAFERIALSEINEATCRTIAFDHAPRLSAQYIVQMTREAVGAVVEYAQQFSSNFAQPEHTLRFFEEVCAAATHKKGTVERDDVQHTFSQRVGLPTVQTKKEQNSLETLTERLEKRVHAQDHAVAAVSETIQSAWLGLKDPTKPMGSFLFLGPSGVGKTELAKAIAEQAYGHEKSVLRLDMSEFAETHTAQRLLGAPPGYVGYEAGGQLTDFVRQKPFSLILLDEIEKAHPSLFDIFLQVLDDGRLTDGHGRTVDFTKTIIIATSNIGTKYIVEEATHGYDVTQPSWRDRHLLPLLLQHFRPEFINRFSGTVVFKPFSVEDLVAIARLEIKKFEERFKDRHLQISVSNEWLHKNIMQLNNPLFGARPVKRFIEETCERSLRQELLSNVPV